MKAFIIQARLGSTRLPNKIILPFYKEKTILDILIDNLKKYKECDIILATSINKENDILESIAHNKGIKCYRGSEQDVLSRFIDAAKEYNVDKIIRICSDNPMMDMSSINQLVSNDHEQYDYVSFMVNGKPSIKTHFGFWAEYVTLEALDKVKNCTTECIYHEHVTNYIYTHPDEFKIKWLNVPNILTNRDDIRMTIDTSIDFNIVKNIYSDLKMTGKEITIDHIVSYLDSHSNYIDIMQNEINKNVK